jgi:DNA-3-methyladenine glycosylase II
MKKEIINHFKKIDLRILDLIARYEITLPKKSSSDKYYTELTKNIAYQQLTDKAANAIYSRLTTYLKTEHFKPKDILKLDVEQLRSFGFSYTKSNYILNIAKATKEIDFEKLDELSDEEILKQLTNIKGVGQWTAQMFLLFTIRKRKHICTQRFRS